MMRSISHFAMGQAVSESECCVTYRVAMQRGSGTAEVYSILPGVEVLALAFEADSFEPVLHPVGNVLELNYCMEGRAECRMKDGCLQYIGTGDLFLSTLHNHSDSIALPLSHYKGIAVILDLDAAAAVVKRWLPDSHIDLHQMAERLLSLDECLLIESNPTLQRILSDVMHNPARLRLDALRLRILELLLYLAQYDPAERDQKTVYERQQVEIAKQVHERMTGRPDYHFTIGELAKEFCISPTALKASFKGVYGAPIASYMKEYRMKQAAALLRDTGQTVAEIAAGMGYESQSKFGAAFKSAMGMTPVEYRNSHRKNDHRNV